MRLLGARIKNKVLFARQNLSGQPSDSADFQLSGKGLVNMNGTEQAMSLGSVQEAQGLIAIDEQIDIGMRQASNSTVQAMPMGAVRAPQGLIAIDEQSDHGMLNDTNGTEQAVPINEPSDDGKRRKNASHDFLETIGLTRGEMCKEDGESAGLGCSLGCTCRWYQYCDGRAEKLTRYKNAGRCSRHWVAILGLIVGISCLCSCILQCIVNDDDVVSHTNSKGSDSSSRSGKDGSPSARLKRSASNRTPLSQLWRTVYPPYRTRRRAMPPIPQEVTSGTSS